MINSDVNPFFEVGPIIVLNSACKTSNIFLIKVLNLKDLFQYLGVKIKMTINKATQLFNSLKEEVGSKIENKFLIMFNCFVIYF